MPLNQEMVLVQSFASHAHRSHPRSNPQTEVLRQLLRLAPHQLVMERYQAPRILPPERLVLPLLLLRPRLPVRLPPQRHRLQLLCLLQDRRLHRSLHLDPCLHFKARQTLRFRALHQFPPPRVWVMAPSHH